MFEQKTYKTFIITLIQLLLLVILIIGYFIEFVSYFAITDTFTLLDLPLGSASIIEFIIFLVLSVLLGLISIILIRVRKQNKFLEYLICITIIILNILKLIFFIPSITLDKTYLFFTIKQFVPIVTNTLPVLFGFIKISDMKYEKYK
ncbi:hypothetical protein GC105_03695 [Alkalibaculum sp. M08DMB]|uniref:Uncharacterized protein n=1 Tax=Alkalibaculum sporogenes TaxID=2655001 RepID=A0A6A7K704_9FIRM|nr:hypothetical protein [Alkalibaculum sporogenes]MPW24893.1 hypothetical protein [Alkalibaculum sporogenes]